jgi:hypothetical protein
VIYIYTIQINLESETFNNVEHYFWCVLKADKDRSSNFGHGWSPSIKQAALDAYEYYIQNVVKNHPNS